MTTAPYRATAGDSEPEVVVRGETFSLLSVYFFVLSRGSFGLYDPKNSVIFHGYPFARFYQCPVSRAGPQTNAFTGTNPI